MSAGQVDPSNFKDLCEEACITLWGEPDKRDPKELRWNGHDAYSAKTFSLKKRTWYDHGAQRGGGLLDLVAYSKGQPKQKLRGKAFFDARAEAYKMGLVLDPPPLKGNSGGGPIVTAYPYVDEAGQLLFEVVRFDTANASDRFRQRRPDGNGGWIWNLKGVRSQVLYRLPALMAAVNAGQRVLICEGERDADTAARLGFPATPNPGGVNKWFALYDEFLPGADVVIVSDNDPQARDPSTGAPQFHPDGRPVHVGQDHAAKLAKRLCETAAHVRIVIFEQKDLSAWREAGGNRVALDALIDAATDLVKQPPPEPGRDPGPDPDGKPRLRVEPSHPDRTVTALRDILAKSDRLYDRGTPARVAFDQGLDGSKAHALTADGLILEAHFACQPFTVTKAKGVWVEQPAPLPLNVARMYLNWAGEWRLPPLNGVTTSPLLANDGGIRTTQGYDPATGLWCENIPDVASIVPLRPIKADAEAALARVRDFFKTFCFADAETVPANGLDVVDIRKQPGKDESCFLASLLGSVCRASLWLAPGYLFRGAPHSGSGAGKGKSARCICNIAYGRQPSAIAPGSNAEELEKRIAAALLEGGPAVLFDNFNNLTLRSASLESALTERPAKVRQFRTLDLLVLNALASAYVTGNGVVLARDLVRRFIATEFDARIEDPEQRRFPGDILAESLRQRRDLLAALLAIWRWGRIASLKPGLTLGSYEQWCAWARDPLVALGCKDPVERLSETKGHDPFRQTATELFTVWWRYHGSSLQKACQLDLEVQKIIDPHGRGRQFVAGQLEKYAGTRLAGFVLTRHKGLNPRDAATYKLEETQSTDPAHGRHEGDLGCLGREGEEDSLSAGPANEAQGNPRANKSTSKEPSRSRNGIQHPHHAYHAAGMWKSPPEDIRRVGAGGWRSVPSRRRGRCVHSSVAWPSDPPISDSIRDNYDAILDWLKRESGRP